MELPSFDEFQRLALREGFDAVLERDWAPNMALDVHTHPFAAQALVVRGEMWLTVGDATQHLRAGDTFTLAFEEPHAERYGPEGATYWVARCNAGR